MIIQQAKHNWLSASKISSQHVQYAIIAIPHVLISFLFIISSAGHLVLAAQNSRSPSNGADLISTLHHVNPTVSNSPLMPSIRLAIRSTSNSPSSQQISPAHPKFQVPLQSKSLKFTLTSGKLWRFNIKANSFGHTHKEADLRLHKNVSANNYIIDDDGWFQYNPQQQQLFAWPSLNIKSGTYYFVLLPSGVDIEADGENTVDVEVVASIVVELMRPIYQGETNDLNQVIDHKFSLDYLHRHSSYPLLLQQVISVFETISKTNELLIPSPSLPTTIITSLSGSTTIAATTTLMPVSLQQQQQQRTLRFGNRLSDYLLISLTFSPDGELFSLTWSTHPTLNNHTLVRIDECRVSAINQTVTRLSGLSSGYQSSDEKYVIYYSINASLLNSHAIVPTERGNYALKVSLNEPCHRTKVLEDLGITASNVNVDNVGSNSIYLEVSDKGLVLIDPPTSSASSSSATQQGIVVTTQSPSLPSPEAIDSSTAKTQVTTNTTFANSYTSTTTTTTTAPTITQPEITTIATNYPISSTPVVDSSSHAPPPDDLPEDLSEKNRIDSDSTDFNSSEKIFQQQRTKSPPQAKSLANFFETTANSGLMMDTTASAPITLSSVIAATNNDSLNKSYNLTELARLNPNDSTLIVVPSNITTSSQPEPTLNEDFLVILNDAMDLLVSIAVPVSIGIGAILAISIIIAFCSLRLKRRKSKQFDVKDRFKYRYGSERRAFLKNGSRPVILDADQKSLSMGGTPTHRQSKGVDKHRGSTEAAYIPMSPIMVTGDPTPEKNGDNNGQAVISGETNN